MATFRNLSMKAKILILGITFVIGFATIAVLTQQTISKIRVGSTQYKQIVADKDLLADCLPPLLYVVESYLNTQLMQNTHDPVFKAEAIEKYKEFENSYKTSM